MDPITQGLTPEQILMLIQSQQLSQPGDYMPEMPAPAASPFAPSPTEGMPFEGNDLPQGSTDMASGDKMIDMLTAPAKGVVGQFDKAGDSLAQTAMDPSMSNAANAGVQTGLAIGSPGMMGMSALLGFGGAAGKDLGLWGTNPAEARSKSRKQAPEKIDDLPGLTPEMQGGYKSAMDKLNRGDFRNGAERRAIEGEVKMYRDLATQAAGSGIKLDEERKRAERGEYDRRVKGAEGARAREMGRDRRFSETEVGKLFDKMGGLAPFAAATGAGALHRLGAGPAKGMMDELVKPLATGTAAAFTAASAPSAYNYLYTEPDNPRKRALEEYGRELPPGHERKQESLDAASQMPSTNPVKEAAGKEWEPAAIMRRLGVSAAEGVGAPLASSVTGMGTRIARERAATKAANHRGVAPSAQTPAQRASAAQAAQARKSELGADIKARVDDPATAQWFEQAAGQGPVQRLRAFNEAHGTSYNQRQLGDLERRIGVASKDKATLDAIESLKADVKAQVAQDPSIAAVLAMPGNAAIKQTAQLKELYVQKYPALADMSAKRINQILRDAAQGR